VRKPERSEWPRPRKGPRIATRAIPRLSLSTSTAEAGARVYIRTGYASSANYYTGSGPWYAVRAYYFGGPWSGNGYSYTDWADYAARNGIGCVPGTAIKGGDNIMYNCQ